MTARKVIGCKRPDGGAGCEVTLGCAGCHRAIYEQEDTPAATCGHVSCARREHLVAVLIKAALDLAIESDHLKNDVPLDAEKKERVQDYVVRVHDAIEQLGWTAEHSIAAAKPCQHVVVVQRDQLLAVCDQISKIGAERGMDGDEAIERLIAAVGYAKKAV